MVIAKREDVTKQGFCQILSRKLRLRGSLLLELIQFLGDGVGVGALLSLSGIRREVAWGGRIFQAGRLLTFSAFRMGAYSRWALIRGWALIRINTVHRQSVTNCSHVSFLRIYNIRYCPNFNGTVIRGPAAKREISKYWNLFSLVSRNG